MSRLSHAAVADLIRVMSWECPGGYVQTQTDSSQIDTLGCFKRSMIPTRFHAGRPRVPAEIRAPSLYSFVPGGLVPKPNYHQARKQRELTRKTRQQEKQQRRASRASEPGVTAAETPVETRTVRDPAAAGDGG